MVKTDHIQDIVALLKQDNVIVAPCDTILGLVARVNEHTLNALNTIKNRALDHAFLMLVSDIDMVKQWAKITPHEEALMKKYWPGPLTIVFDKQDYVSEALTGGKQTIAIRYPDYDPLNQLLAAIGEPVFSTSVNETKQAHAIGWDDISEEINQSIGGWYTCPIAKKPLPSTIVRLEGDLVHVLRQGAVQV